MKIETITYKRVKNLGNYQSETFEAIAIIEPGEDAEIAAEKLRVFVYSQLYPSAFPIPDTESPKEPDF